MRKVNIIFGIIIFIAPWFFYKAKFRELNTQREGKVVKMKIIDKPESCLGTKVKWFMKVEYNGKIFSKQISGSYCEKHQIGNWVEIIYLEGSNIILLPTESVWKDIFAGLGISIFGLIVIIYYGIIKKLFQ